MQLILTDNKDYSKYLDLLLLADPDIPAIEKYIFKSDLFILKQNNAVIAVCAVTRDNKEQCEIKNIAVLPDMHNKGIGAKLCNKIFDYYKKEGLKAIFVGTAYNIPKAAKFYGKLGFIPFKTIKNFFIDNYPEPIFDDGLQCIDMTILKRTL